MQVITLVPEILGASDLGERTGIDVLESEF
jgi:hypothetical protein